MDLIKDRIAGLTLAALAAAATSSAQAQDTPLPAPTPTPSASPLPGVVPERFTLGAPRVTTPQVVVPAATPTPSATRRPRPVPTPSPSASATPRTRQPAAPAESAVPEATPTPAPLPSPSPTILSTPIEATPAPVATATAAPLPAPEQRGDLPPWLWALAGAGVTALAFGLVGYLRRRSAPEPVMLPEPVAATLPPPEPRPVAEPAPRRAATPPVQPAPAPAPAKPAVPAPPPEPFDIQLRPLRLELGERDVALDFELLVANTQRSAAENIRASLALVTASPDQDRHIAGFHASPMVDQAGAPFDLPAGSSGSLPLRLALPRELLHVVEVSGRPMFVPLLMIDLRWRGGLSIRRFGADFMIGTAGQGDKLGPIWLDRPAPSQLSASRYFARQIA